jgi:hypothetical protein
MKKQFQPSLLLLAAFTTALAILSQPAIAQASQPTQNQNIFEQIQSQFDSLKSSVSGIFDQIKGVGEDLSHSLGDLQVPDLNKAIQSILSGSSNKDEGGRIAGAVEGQPTEGNGAYTVRKDQAKEAVRAAATANAQGSTLSSDAQSRLKESLQQAALNTQQSAQMAEDSQKTDVTQHIMQNVSQQLANQAQLQQRLIEQGQQSQVNAAMQTVVLSQIAQETAAANLVDRRENASMANRGVTTRGYFILPGGHTLDIQTSPQTSTK